MGLPVLPYRDEPIHFLSTGSLRGHREAALAALEEAEEEEFSRAEEVAARHLAAAQSVVLPRTSAATLEYFAAYAARVRDAR